MDTAWLYGNDMIRPMFIIHIAWHNFHKTSWLVSGVTRNTVAFTLALYGNDDVIPYRSVSLENKLLPDYHDEKAK